MSFPRRGAFDSDESIDAGHADAAVAYVSVNAIRRDDLRPHVYRTHDSGATWAEIVNGLPPIGPVNVVREDPKQPGLLFAGTERQVYFSSDDGEHWQSLRQNMPASSVRDLVIHEDDPVVGTHGRSIWILDGISVLRQPAQAVRATQPFLFTPPRATRVRWNMFSDTPLPPEEPAGQNSPDGAILNYYLPAATTEVVLDVVVRGTSTSPAGPYVHPGRYTLRLTAGGAIAERTLDVRLDPRVAIGDADVQLQTAHPAGFFARTCSAR